VTELRFIVYHKPVSTNAAYRRRGRGPGFYMTDKAKRFKVAINDGAFVAAHRAGWKKSKAVTLSIVYWNMRANADVDGPNKLVQDALQKVIYANDSAVISVQSRKDKDGAIPRVEIVVTDESVQERAAS
jgi:Holliday junction resolvase RusA-like endonuclease